MPDHSILCEPPRAGPAAGAAQRLSFRHYLATRRYDFGRGTRAAWVFIAAARGDPDMPDARSWRELHDHILRNWPSGQELAGARAVWSSYSAWRSRARNADFGIVWRRS